MHTSNSGTVPNMHPSYGYCLNTTGLPNIANNRLLEGTGLGALRILKPTWRRDRFTLCEPMPRIQPVLNTALWKSLLRFVRLRLL